MSIEEKRRETMVHYPLMKGCRESKSRFRIGKIDRSIVVGEGHIGVWGRGQKSSN